MSTSFKLRRLLEEKNLSSSLSITSSGTLKLWSSHICIWIESAGSCFLERGKSRLVMSSMLSYWPESKSGGSSIFLTLSAGWVGIGSSVSVITSFVEWVIMMLSWKCSILSKRESGLGSFTLYEVLSVNVAPELAKVSCTWGSTTVFWTSGSWVCFLLT